MRVLTAVPVAALAIAALPSSAQADHSSCDKPLETTYSNRYYAVKKAHGTRAPGRNIRKWGVLRHGHTRDATCKQIARSAQQLRRLLTAPKLMHSVPVPPPQKPAGVSSDRDVASLPDCTWRPESGGSYTAVNGSSGAYGKYQIIPSTWAAHCSDLGRDPAGQERCAARVYEAQGAGAWVNC
jgi:hypothetical protein